MDSRTRRKGKNNSKGNDGDTTTQHDNDGQEAGNRTTGGPYRQWLYDRIYGVPRPIEGKYDQQLDLYPPSVLCLPTSLLWSCPYLLEENRCCQSLGGWGYCTYPWSRKATMKYALLVNILCIVTGILTCQTIANNSSSSSSSSLSFIMNAPMTQIQLLPEPTLFTNFDATVYIGLSAIVLDNPTTGIREMIPFDQFCTVIEQGGTRTTERTESNITTNSTSDPDDTMGGGGGGGGGGLETLFQRPADSNCHKCETVRPQMVTGLFVAIIFLIPSIICQCTRLYETTDLNCCKCGSIVMELTSLGGFILTWVQFYYECFKPTFIRKETLGYTREGYLSEPDSFEEAVLVTFQWTIGNGMIYLFATFGLKLISLLCHICLPTPTITRNTYEQKLYESKITHMGLSKSSSSSSQRQLDGRGNGAGSVGAGSSKANIQRDVSFSEDEMDLEEESQDLYIDDDDDDDDNNTDVYYDDNNNYRKNNNNNNNYASNNNNYYRGDRRTMLDQIVEDESFRSYTSSLKGGR